MLVAITTACSDSGSKSTINENQLIRSQLGLLSAEETAAVLRAGVSASEQATADCMDSAGFEYAPLSMEDTVSSNVDEYASKFSEDYIDRFGFGLATIPPVPPKPSAATKRNDEILHSMTQSGQQQYVVALQSCQVSASTAVPNVSDRLAKVVDRVRSDSEYLAAVDAWANCSWSTGLHFASWDEANEHFSNAAAGVDWNNPSQVQAAATEELGAAETLKKCTVPFGVVRSSVFERLIAEVGS